MRRTIEHLKLISAREQPRRASDCIELITESELRLALESGFLHPPYQFQLIGTQRLHVEVGEEGFYLPGIRIPFLLNFNPETKIYTILTT